MTQPAPDTTDPRPASKHRDCPGCVDWWRDTPNTLTDTRGAVAGLSAVIGELKSRNAQLLDENIRLRRGALPANELVALIREMLLCRAGLVIDEAVAEERARNIAAALSGMVTP